MTKPKVPMAGRDVNGFASVQKKSPETAKTLLAYVTTIPESVEASNHFYHQCSESENKDLEPLR
jgi:hypothetical protein